MNVETKEITIYNVNALAIDDHMIYTADVSSFFQVINGS
jgi:hypothetical protein